MNVMEHYRQVRDEAQAKAKELHRGVWMYQFGGVFGFRFAPLAPSEYWPYGDRGILVAKFDKDGRSVGKFTDDE